MQQSSRIVIAVLIIIMLIILQSLNGMSNSSDGTSYFEPALFDNEDGNWTAVWDLDNPMNYTLSRIELDSGKATLKLKNINFKENPSKGFRNGSLDLLRIYGTFGLGLDLSKNYYTLISDTNNNRVVQVDYSKWVRQYGSNTSSGYGQNLLNKPSFALPLEDNATLITDTVSNRVLVIGHNGEFIWQYGSNSTSGIGDNRLNLPASAVPTNQNQILIADTGNNYVVEVNHNKEWIWQYGFISNDPGIWDPSNSDLLNPTYGEQTHNGTILISDRGNHRVLEVTRAKQNIWQYGKKGLPGTMFNRLNAPQYATKLENGNILIADTNNHRVIEIDRTGVLKWQYGKTGSSGSGLNRLAYPACATRFPNGNTLITDAGNHRVIEVNITGTIIWQYGTNGSSGTGVNYLNTPHSAFPIKKESLVGVFVSQVIDGGDITNWTTINWDPILTDNTYILLFTQTGNSPIVTQSGWSGWSEVYDDYRGENITSPANRYIQYAAMFISYNPNMSPFLKDVNVNGTKYEQNGELITEYFAPPDLISWQSLSWDVQSFGQTLQPFYKTSDEMLWHKVKSTGDLTGVPTESGKIKLRFSFSTSNPIISPILDDISLVFERLGDISRIEIIPDYAEVTVGDQLDLIAEGYDFYGRKLVIEPSWTSNIGIIENGTFYPQNNVGVGFINATYANVTGSAMITLLPGPLEIIDVEPNEVSIIAGEEQYFEAFGLDRFGNEVLIEPKWESDIGKMNDNLLTAQDFAGTGTVKAKVENIMGIANVTVELNSSRHHPPKILEKVPDQIKSEDSLPWMLNLATYEWDDEDRGETLVWYLTDIDEKLYSVTGGYSKEDVLTFIPKPNAYGNNLATLNLKDSDNMTTSQPLWVNITPVNDKPIISLVPDIAIHYEESYKFDYSNYIHDVETTDDQLILSVIEPVGQKHTSVTGLNVTYNYPKNMFGESVTITLRVSDDEDFVEEYLDVAITDNHAPILIKQFSDITMAEGEIKNHIFNLDDYFDDADGDDLTYFFSAEILAINVFKNNSVTISSTSSWSGTETITFRAIDPFGGMAEGYLKVIVKGVNNPPLIHPIPIIYVHYDIEYKFDLSPYISDPDNDTSELDIWTSDIEHINFDGSENTIMILYYPERLLGQSMWITLNVSDGLAIAWEMFKIEVTDNFPPEISTNLVDVYFPEDNDLKNAFNLLDYFTDADMELLSFSYKLVDSENVSITINTDNSVDFSSKENWYGETYVTFKAKDHSKAFIEGGLKVVVIPVNDPPTITEVPPQNGIIGERWVLDLSPYLSDIDNNVTELQVSIDSEFVSIVGNQITFSADKRINTQLDITISDGNLNTTGTIQLIITGRDNGFSGESQQMIWFLLVIIILIILGIIAIVVKKRRGNYSVSDVFIIHKNGILVKYLGNTLKENSDEDIISGMLTAVQSFITESFGSNTQEGKDAWKLNQLKMGNHEILIERGENIFVPIIYKGQPGQRLPDLLNKTVERIDDKYGVIFDNWNGNYTYLKGIEDLIKPLLTQLPDHKKEQESPAQLIPSKTQQKNPNSLPEAPTKPSLQPSNQGYTDNQNSPPQLPTKQFVQPNSRSIPQLPPYTLPESQTHQTTNELPKKMPKKIPVKQPKNVPNQPPQQYYSQPPQHISTQPVKPAQLYQQTK